MQPDDETWREDARVLQEWAGDVFLFGEEALQMSPSEPIDELRGVQIPFTDAHGDTRYARLFDDAGRLVYHDLSFYTVDMFKNQDKKSFKAYKGTRFTWQQTVKLTAYHLFFNPDQRAIFSDGLALRGEEIKQIVPDYHATMEWNPTHTLGDEDMNELRDLGVDRRLRDAMSFAKQVAQIGDPHDLRVPLAALKQKHHALLDGQQTARLYAQGDSVQKLLEGRNSYSHPIP